MRRDCVCAERVSVCGRLRYIRVFLLVIARIWCRLYSAISLKYNAEGEHDTPPDPQYTGNGQTSRYTPRKCWALSRGEQLPFWRLWYVPAWGQDPKPTSLGRTLYIRAKSEVPPREALRSIKTKNRNTGNDRIGKVKIPTVAIGGVIHIVVATVSKRHSGESLA